MVEKLWLRLASMLFPMPACSAQRSNNCISQKASQASVGITPWSLR